MKTSPNLSIVVPAYNEEKIIKKNMAKVRDYLKRKGVSWEIVVSDDGSKDKTVVKVRQLRNRNIRVVRLKNNQGKGAAIRNGMRAARGKYIIFMDADLSVPIKYIEKFLEVFEKGEDVIIASRRVEGARIEVHQPIHRELMGRVFTFLTQVITGVDVADFTCGFKGFSQKASEKVFNLALIDRWAYDAEIMFLAKRHGYNIVQEPIVWKNREDTRVRLKEVVFETFRDLFKIRINDKLGIYGKKG